MKKLYFSALALCFALNTTQTYGSAHDDCDTEKSVTSLALPIDALAADKPEEAVKLAQTQNDLSDFLKIEIASAIKSHYPFLEKQLETLRVLGVEPSKKCTPLLTNAYHDGGFILRDLKTIPVSSIDWNNSSYRGKLLGLLRDALNGVEIDSVRVKEKIPLTFFPFESYQKIEAHIKEKFEEFVVMVLGESLADKKDGKSEVK